MTPRTTELLLLACLLVCSSSAARGAESRDSRETNDYPTSARADYVLACMAANGQTRTALENCSCSIDVIASIIPHDRYVQAETVLSMRQGVGQSASIFRSTRMFDDIVADLKRAQAEAEVRCFR